MSAKMLPWAWATPQVLNVAHEHAGANDISQRRPRLSEGGLNLAQDVGRLRGGITWVLGRACFVGRGGAGDEHHVVHAHSA